MERRSLDRVAESLTTPGGVGGMREPTSTATARGCRGLASWSASTAWTASCSSRARRTRRSRGQAWSGRWARARKHRAAARREEPDESPGTISASVAGASPSRGPALAARATRSHSAGEGTGKPPARAPKGLSAASATPSARRPPASVSPWAADGVELRHSPAAPPRRRCPRPLQRRQPRGRSSRTAGAGSA